MQKNGQTDGVQNMRQLCGLLWMAA